MNIERALISVYDKRGLEHLASYLNNNAVDIISTGGTYEYLKKFGIKVQSVEEYTGVVEMFDGRIKTISPRIAGGILADRSKTKHLDQMVKANIPNIDMIVVNLCPFKEFSKETFDEFELIDKIDIGGINIIRSAAKNYRDVLPIVDPTDYEKVINSLDYCGDVPLQSRRKLALKAFYSTMKYEESIHEALSFLFAEEKYKHLTLERLEEFKYGDNPHQEAFLLKIAGEDSLFDHVEFLTESHLTLRLYRQIFNGISFMKNMSTGGFTVLINLRPVFFSQKDDDEAYLKLIQEDLQNRSDGNSAFISKGCIHLSIAEYILRNRINTVIASDFSKEAEALLRTSNVNLLAKCHNFEYAKTHRIFLENEVLLQQKDSVEDFGNIIQRYSAQGHDQFKDDLLLAIQMIRVFETNATLRLKKGRMVSISSGMLNAEEALEVAISRFKNLSQQITGGVLAFDSGIGIDVIKKAFKEWRIECILKPKDEKDQEAILEFVKEKDISLYEFDRRHYA
ncbi:MAG: hypothetical protein ACOC34_03945 [Thermotogota bacterium]